jgi:hypothetical protein
MTGRSRSGEMTSERPSCLGDGLWPIRSLLGSESRRGRGERERVVEARESKMGLPVQKGPNLAPPDSRGFALRPCLASKDAFSVVTI